MTSRSLNVPQKVVAGSVERNGDCISSLSSRPLGDSEDWHPKRKILLLVTAAGETNAGMYQHEIAERIK